MQDLFEAARAAFENAHAPYSAFRVGAAVRTASGRIFAGANVENASYPEGNCAEASALAAMVAAGERTIAEALVLAAGERLCTPCGGCRQRLAEFAGPDVPIHLCDPDGLRAHGDPGRAPAAVLQPRRGRRRERRPAAERGRRDPGATPGLRAPGRPGPRLRAGRDRRGHRRRRGDRLRRAFPASRARASKATPADWCSGASRARRSPACRAASISTRASRPARSTSCRAP